MPSAASFHRPQPRCAPFASGVLVCLALVGCGQSLPDSESSASLQPQGLVEEIRTTVTSSSTGSGEQEQLVSSLAPTAVAKNDSVNFTSTDKWAVTITGGLSFELAWQRVLKQLGANVKATISGSVSGTLEATTSISQTLTVVRQPGQGWRLYKSATGHYYSGIQVRCNRFTNACGSPTPFTVFVATGTQLREEYYDTAGWCKFTPPSGGWYNFNGSPPPGGIKAFPVYLGGPEVSVVYGEYAPEGWYGQDTGLSVRGGWIVYQPVDSTRCSPFDVGTLPAQP